MIQITFDPAKRDRALAERQMDFAHAALVFEGLAIDIVDQRRDYGETRIITVGHLGGRMVIVVWTSRGDARHIISMRKANEREQRTYGERLGED